MTKVTFYAAYIKETASVTVVLKFAVITVFGHWFKK